MTKILVLYNTPANTVAFNRHYRQTHIPLAKKVPGLRSILHLPGERSIALPETKSQAAY